MGLKAQNCQASFSYSIIHEISSFTYHFKNTSTSNAPITKTLWTFGDGSSSIKKNPEHQYLQEGIYVVNLMIYTADSCYSSTSDTIKVTNVVPPNCMAFFTFVRLQSSPDFTYAFTDHSVFDNNDTISSWSWNFDDGSYSSQQNPIHQFLATGNYNVQLHITTKMGCSSSYNFVISIFNGSSPCNASFTYQPDTLTNPLKYYFHDNSNHATNITKWSWHFDDGDSSNLQDPNHIFPYAGIYFVSLKITTSGGCTSSTTFPVKVGNPQKYNLWGRVYAGPYVIDKCIAYLYREYHNEYFKAIDTVRLTSVNDTLGVYYFFQIPEGRYKVKVLLPDSSTYSQNYAPTYYGDATQWKQANQLQLFQDISMANINMEALVPSVGSCLLKGKVQMNISNLGVENTEILALNQSGQIVDYAFSDANGDFIFSNLAQGQYWVTGDVTGMHADLIPISFNSIADTIDNLILTVDHNILSGYFLIDPSEKMEVNIYPNPVQNLLHLQFDYTGNEAFDASIYTIDGRLVQRQTIYFLQKNTALNIKNLDRGIYYLKISNPTKNVSVGKRFIKM